MTKLHDLYDPGGQSPWLDNLKRSYLTSGRLAELVAEGIRGLTSNPTIMAKAIAAGDDYDEQFAARLARRPERRGRLLGPRRHRRDGRPRGARPVYDVQRRRATASSRSRSHPPRPRHRRHDRGGARAARAHRRAERPREDPGDAEGSPAIER